MRPPVLLEIKEIPALGPSMRYTIAATFVGGAESRYCAGIIYAAPASAIGTSVGSAAMIAGVDWRYSGALSGLLDLQSSASSSGGEKSQTYAC